MARKLVIFKRKTLPKEKFPAGVIKTNPKAWMDEEKMSEWLREIYVKRPVLWSVLFWSFSAELFPRRAMCSLFSDPISAFLPDRVAGCFALVALFPCWSPLQTADEWPFLPVCLLIPLVAWRPQSPWAKWVFFPSSFCQRIPDALRTCIVFVFSFFENKFLFNLFDQPLSLSWVQTGSRSLTTWWLFPQFSFPIDLCWSVRAHQCCQKTSEANWFGVCHHSGWIN